MFGTHCLKRGRGLSGRLFFIFISSAKYINININEQVSKQRVRATKDGVMFLLKNKADQQE